MENYRLVSPELHVSIDISKVAIGNQGTAIDNGVIAMDNGAPT